MYINSKSYMHGTFCHSHCYINMLFQLNVCITACRYVVLFHTTLFFHTMLAPDFSCAMSRENLCNVGTALHLQQPVIKKLTTNQFKIKITKKRCYSDDIALGFFQCSVAWSLLWAALHTMFFLCNVVPIVIWHYWTEFLHVMCNFVYLGSLLEIIACTRFSPVHSSYSEGYLG